MRMSVFLVAFLVLSLSHADGQRTEDTSAVTRDCYKKGWGKVKGVLQFRGNPMHNWYGEGPVPKNPRKLWSYPDKAMGGKSLVGKEMIYWGGTGWTGQPVVRERADGVTEVIVGAFDSQVHFINAETGKATRTPFKAGDLVKGSVTLDPDGFPLLYAGSRDAKYRILSIQGDPAKELWSMDSHDPPDGKYDKDWDGNASIINDIMYLGGENSIVYAVKLNRAYDEKGQVTVRPEIILQMAGYTQKLMNDVGDYNVSIENSVAVFGNHLYFANGGGRVAGIDIGRIENKKAPFTFDFWAGDDTDASIVIDEQERLYVAIEKERFNKRSEEVGQLIKLDPAKPEKPLLWSVQVPPHGGDGMGGIWATPALGNRVLYVPTHPGDLLAVDRETGEVVWREHIGYHEWSSPLIVDNRLIVGECSPGGIACYNIDDERNPVLEWKIPTNGCVESSPILWKGRIIVGTRGGFVYAFGD